MKKINYKNEETPVLHKKIDFVKKNKKTNF